MLGRRRRALVSLANLVHADERPSRRPPCGYEFLIAREADGGFDRDIETDETVVLPRYQAVRGAVNRRANLPRQADHNQRPVYPAIGAGCQAWLHAVEALKRTRPA